MKYIAQTTVSECGLACLAMVISEYNLKISMAQLRNQWRVGRDGLTFKDIKYIANNYGLVGKGVKTNNPQCINSPAIIYNGVSHFVVVESVKKDILTIFDPANGIYKGTISEVCGNSEVIALVFTKKKEGEDAITVENNREVLSTFRYTVQLLSKEKTKILYFIVLATLVQLLNLVGPIVIQKALNQMVKYKTINKEHIYILIILSILFPIVYFLRMYVSNSLKVKFDTYILKDYVSKIIHMPYSIFTSFSNEDIVYRYNGGVVLREVFSEQFFSLWINLGTALIALIYVSIQSVSISIILLLVSTIQILVYIFGYSRKKYLSGREMREQANSLGIFMDAIDTMKLIKGNSLEHATYKRWNIATKKYWTIFNMRLNFNGVIDTINNSIMTVAPIGVAVYSMVLVNRGLLSIGAVVSVYMLSNYVVSPITQLFVIIDEIVYGNTYLESMLSIQENKSEELFSNKDFEEKNIEFKLENVAYSYSKLSSNVLENISFDIHQGEFIGIVGESGSGKSTLGLLLVGLLEATQGKISINKENIGIVNKEKFRRNIGIVQQKSSFVSGSIEENIVVSREHDRKKLIEATKKAEIFDFIESLPMGFETPINSRELISGGQLQRLEIARALYGNPRIVLLDEATSSLDSIVEEKIYQNIKGLDTTRIVITHDLNTIIGADKIIVLREGKIVGFGKHKQLLYKNDYYTELFKKFDH